MIPIIVLYFLISLILCFMLHINSGYTATFFYEKKVIHLFDIPKWILCGGGLLLIYTFMSIGRLPQILSKYNYCIFRLTPDPVKGCVKYKEVGCCLVDGINCDYPNCHILDDYLKEKK
jgi:hypothetical protein